jgi:hypothetical protein
VSRSLEQNIVEIGQSGLQLEGHLRLLHHVQSLAPPIRGIQLTEVFYIWDEIIVVGIMSNVHYSVCQFSTCDEDVWRDAVGVNAHHARALGVDLKRVQPVLADGIVDRRGELPFDGRAGVVLKQKVGVSE